MTRRNDNGMNIANKTALITGANRGIRRALVTEALRRGAKRVFAASRGPLDMAHDRVTPVTLDVTSPSQIREAVDMVDSLDVLVNNAGIAMYDDLSNLDLVEQHLQVNFLGMLRVTHAFLPLLKRAKGAVVNQLSLAALAPLPMIFPDPASMSIAEGWRTGVVKSLERDFAAFVPVNATVSA